MRKCKDMGGGVDRAVAKPSGLVLLALLAALALSMLGVPAVAYAAQDATLTLQMRYEASGKAQLVDGVEATAYQVASLDDAVNSYTLLESFSALGVDFNDGLDTAQMISTASRAATIATSQKLAGRVATSGTDGTASFGALPYGVYLVVQSGKTGTAKGYRDFEPFLVSVPQVTDEDVVFQVVSCPKLTPADAVPPTTPQKQVMANTGDPFDVGMAYALLVTGAVALLLGASVRRKRAG